MTNVSRQRIAVKKLHHFSGIILSVFIAFHLLNHLSALAGPGMPAALMEQFRKVYRHPAAESVLLLAVMIQVVSGLRLLRKRKVKSRAEKIQIWSGIYLSFFLLAHVSAVIMGRWIEHLDTNFYFAAAGLNIFPATLFFIPYYFSGVCAIGLHIASLHYLKTRSVRGSYLLGIAGILAAILIIAGYTNFFQWRPIPSTYRQFIGKYFGEK